MCANSRSTLRPSMAVRKAPCTAHPTHLVVAPVTAYALSWDKQGRNAAMPRLRIGMTRVNMLAQACLQGSPLLHLPRGGGNEGWCTDQLGLAVTCCGTPISMARELERSQSSHQPVQCRQAWRPSCSVSTEPSTLTDPWLPVIQTVVSSHQKYLLALPRNNPVWCVLNERI